MFDQEAVLTVSMVKRGEAGAVSAGLPGLPVFLGARPAVLTAEDARLTGPLGQRGHSP